MTVPGHANPNFAYPGRNGGTRYRRWLVAAITTVLLTLLDPNPATGQSMEDTPARLASPAADPLERYLLRFGLEDLLIRQMEGILGQEQDPGQRRQLARRLLQLYDRHSESGGPGLESAAATRDALATEFPDLIDDATRLSIALGTWQRARAGLDRWIWNGNQDRSPTEIHQQFADLVDRAEALVARTAAAPQSEQDMVPDESDPGLVLGNDRRPEIPPTGPERLSARSPLALQAEFLLAWSLYDRALSDQVPESRKADLQRASQIFNRLLRVPAETELTELRPSWFALESQWLCRILIGLGMVSHALGDRLTGDYCFALLGELRVPPQIRQYQRTCRFQSLFQAGQIRSAADLAEDLAENDLAATTDTSLWRVVAMAGLGGRVAAGLPADYDRMSLTGLGELVKQQDWASIDRLFDEFDRAVTGEGFLASWLEGYRQLHGVAGKPGNLDLAMERLAAAVEQGRGNNPGLTAEQQFSLRARCRYHFGFALYRDHQFEAAADQFHQATTVLDYSDPATAEHSLWMQCQSLEKLSSRNSLRRSSLRAALDEFQSRYPRSGRIGDARFLQMLVQLDGQGPAAAMKALHAIPPDHSSYSRALFELCRLAHQQWAQAELSGDRQSLAGEVIKAADRFRLAADARGDLEANESQHVRVCLLAADVLIHGNPPDPAAAREWLDRCGDGPSRTAGHPQLLSDWYYLDLAVAGAQGLAPHEPSAARWLADHAFTAAQRRAGLMYLAESMERRAEEPGGLASSAAHRDDAVRQAIELYQQVLATDSGATPSLTVPDLVRARARLAQWQLETGQVAAAHEHFAELVRMDPQRIDWLRGLAGTAMAQQNWNEAAGIWQRIAGGSPAGNEQWLEAKYNLLTCLLELQSPQAGPVWQQAVLLVPEMPEPWSSRFDQLQSRLNPGGRNRHPNH